MLPVSPSSSSEGRIAPAHFDSDTANLTTSNSVRRHHQTKKVCFAKLLCHKNRNQLNNNPNSDPTQKRRKVLIASSGTFTRSFAKFRRRREMRLLRTLVIILVILVVSTVPLGILFIISFAETDKRYVLAAKILLTTSLVNSMVNPWVYFWRFVEMRTALKKMF